MPPGLTIWQEGFQIGWIGLHESNNQDDEDDNQLGSCTAVPPAQAQTHVSSKLSAMP
jgi:hypothetical protein